MECTKCAFFKKEKTKYRCTKLKTVCNICKNPDMGTKLPGCKFEEQKNKDSKSQTNPLEIEENTNK